MPDWSRCAAGSHINVAKHGWCGVSFWPVMSDDDFGSKNDGKGGGGIDSIMSGGGSITSMQSMQDIFMTTKTRDDN